MKVDGSESNRARGRGYRKAKAKKVGKDEESNSRSLFPNQEVHCGDFSQLGSAGPRRGGAELAVVLAQACEKRSRKAGVRKVEAVEGK